MARESPTRRFSCRGVRERTSDVRSFKRVLPRLTDVAPVEHITDKFMKTARRKSVFRARDIRDVRDPRSTLRRMFQRGKLVQPGRGLYGLPDGELTMSHALVKATRRYPGGVGMPRAADHTAVPRNAGHMRKGTGRTFEGPLSVRVNLRTSEVSQALANHPRTSTLHNAAATTIRENAVWSAVAPLKVIGAATEAELQTEVPNTQPVHVLSIFNSYPHECNIR